MICPPIVASTAQKSSSLTLNVLYVTSFFVLPLAPFRAFSAFVPTVAILLCLSLATPNNAQTLDWANHPVPFSAPDGSSCSAMTHDALGNIYVTGYFRSTLVDFDPGPGVANLTQSGGLDIFIAKYDASGNYIWAKKLGGPENDNGADIALDADGNVYVAGSFSLIADFDPGPGSATLVSAGGGDVFFAKYDASGNYLWAKRIGGTGNQYCTDLVLDGGGNIFLTGAFENTADFDPGAGTVNLTSAGDLDGFFAKYDAAGNYIWAKQIAGTNDASAYSLAVDGSGDIYLTGDFFETADFDPGVGTANLSSAGLSDIFIAKYNASGNYMWAKRIGNTSYDTGTKVLLDGNGDMCLLGYFGGSPDFDPGAGTAIVTGAGDYDCFFAKYDASGNYIWAKGIGGTGRDFGHDLALDANNNFYITGQFRNTVDFDPGAGTVFLTSTGFSDIFIAKYNPSGNYLWSTAIGGLEYDEGACISVSSAGKISVGGEFEDFVGFDFGVNKTAISPQGDIFIMQYSAAFAFEWVNHLVPFQSPGHSSCAAIAKDASGNVYATGGFSGTTVDFDPGPGTANLAGNDDIFIVKYDPLGNYLWAKKIGSIQGTDYASAIALDGNGNIYITGVFEQTVDFDPGAGTAELTGIGRGDVFIAKYDPSGNYLWAKRMGDYEIDAGDAIALDANGNVYITGTFVGTVDFDPGAGTANLVAPGNRNVFIAKYSSAGNYLWAKDIGGPSTDEAGDLALDASGNVYVTGSFQNTADFDPGPGTATLTSYGSADIFIAKYTTAGNYLWAKQMGGTAQDAGRSIALDDNGNVCMTGFFGNTADFDPGPGAATLTSVGDWDIALAKYTSSGSLIWAKSIGGTDYDISQDIALDGNNNIYLTGYFRNTVDFDPGVGVANLTSADESDIFLARYDASGNYAWAKSIENIGTAGGNCLAIGGTGKINMGGRFTGTADFDFGPGTANRTAVGLSADIFIAQYSVSNGVGNGQAPIITCPANIVRTNDPGQCSAVVQYSTPTSDDPQDNVAIVPPSLPSNSAFPIGTNSVTWEATDGGGLTARCTFTVTVSDTQVPAITCPSNQTKGNDPGTCGATTSYLTPTATDNCPLPNGQPVWVSGGTMPQTNGANSTSVFQKGITTVIWKATDAAGLTKTCSFRVIVNDTEVPVISCPGDIAVNSAPNSCASAAVVYGSVTATDNCMPPAPSVVRTGGLPSGSNFPNGVTVVTWRATDGSGKMATCSFKVTVTDGQAPTITCPSNATVTAAPGQCSATAFYTTPTASDNCSLQSAYMVSGLASGSVFPQGVTSITWKAVDATGLTQTCAFTVTVVCGNGKANDAQERTTEGQGGIANLLLAPNPATSEVSVSLEGERTPGETIELSVCDLSGRMVLRQELPAEQSQARLTVATWPSGVYMVMVKGKDMLLAKRLVVE